MDVSLSITNLVCGYKQNKAFIPVPPYAINAEVLKPSLIAVVGKNGVGKSTLLKTIAGILKPDEGSIMISEDELQQIKPRQRACKIAYLPSFNAKVHYLKVEDYLSLGIFPHNQPDRKNELLAKALSDVEMEHKRNVYLNQLSDGEMQRVAIARILVQDSPVMMFDEATSHLDPKFQLKILELFYRLVQQESKIIVFTTHMTGEALHYAHKIWLLADNEFIDKIPEQIIIDKDLERNELTFQLRPIKKANEKTSLEVRLIGDGIPFKYTQFAFLRYGINVVCNKKCHFTVIIQQNPDSTYSWLVKKENSILSEFSDLNKLLEFLLMN